MMRLTPIASLLYAAGYGPTQVAVAFAQTRHYLFYNVPLTVASEFPMHTASPRYMQPPNTPYVNYAQRHLPRGPSRHDLSREKGNGHRKSPANGENSWYSGNVKISYQDNRNGKKIIVRDGDRTVSFGLDSKVNAASKSRKVLFDNGLGQNRGLVGKVRRIAARFEE